MKVHDFGCSGWGQIRVSKGASSEYRNQWEVLNGISPNMLLAEGRVYGGGLLKLEPKELAGVPAQTLACLITKSLKSGGDTGPYLQMEMTARS